MKFTEIWSRLEEDQRASPGTERMQRRILPDSRRNFFLGLEIPSRNRMLILRTTPISIAGQAPVQESRGLKVRMRSRDTDPPTAEIELVLTDQQHLDIFDLLIEDLIDAASQPEDEQAGVGKFLSRLTDWQRLLMRLASGVMSSEIQQGLWGELWVLREVAGPAIGLGAAIRAWRGPLGADQDFQFSGAAFEVKTSTSHTFKHMIIASERQLDVAPDIALVLMALSLNARPDYGETLPVMVHAIRSLANDSGCLGMLEERLVLYGFRDEDAGGYADIGYVVRSRRQFRVHDDFPRVISGEVRPGVSEVSYSIAVPACVPFEITEGELRELLKGAS